jgi:hypothetical protein
MIQHISAMATPSLYRSFVEFYKLGFELLYEVARSVQQRKAASLREPVSGPEIRAPVVGASHFRVDDVDTTYQHSKGLILKRREDAPRRRFFISDPDGQAHRGRCYRFDHKSRQPIMMTTLSSDRQNP